MRWFNYSLNCSAGPRVNTSSSHQRSEGPFRGMKSPEVVCKVLDSEEEEQVTLLCALSLFGTATPLTVQGLREYREEEDLKTELVVVGQ